MLNEVHPPFKEWGKHPLYLFRSKNLFALILGALLPLAFAPFHWFWLLLLIPGCYELCLHRSQKPALTGFLFGLGLFSVGASWIFVSIHEYSESPLLIALIITVGFILILSAMVSAGAWVYGKLNPQSFKQRLIVFPALWALTEAFRGWFLTGFPWLYLGNALVDTPFRGFIPLIGIFGLTSIIVLISMLLIKSWKNIPVLLGFLALGYGLSFMTWTKPVGQSYQVTLLQGNIPQLLKWDPEQAQAHFSRYYQLTKNALDSDILIWPEASLPVPMPFSQPYINALEHLLEPHHNALLIGELYSAGEEGYLNSAQALGDGDHRYDKQHLVPFGEYLPLNNWIGPVLEEFRLPTPNTVPGPADQNPLRLKEWHAGVMICYEIAYSALTLNAAKNTDVLVTISNDTWFGNSFGPEQHLQIAQSRALETGRYLLRATNNGITAFIDPQGQVMARAPQFVVTTLTENIPGMSGHTPLMIYGNLSVLLVLTALVILGSVRKGKSQ